MSTDILKRRLRLGLGLLPVVFAVSLLLYFINQDRAGGGDGCDAGCMLAMIVACLSAGVWLVVLILYFFGERIVEEWSLRWGGRPLTQLDARMVRGERVKREWPIAAILGFTGLILVIVLSGAGIWVLKSNMPAPYKVIEYGTAEELGALIADYPSVLESRPKEGRTLLLAAILCARADMVEVLVAHGVSVNSLHQAQRVPLFYAVDKPWIMEILLRAGAKVNHIDALGYTPLHLAIVQKSKESFEMLVEYGANVNAPASNFKSPLMLAVENGFDVVEYLLDHGADPTVSDMVGQTPLHYAAMLGDENAARALIKAGAQKSARTAQEWTPIHLAAIYGKQGVAEVLLDSGVNVDSSNKRNQTPLRCAVHRGRVDMIRFLLDRGADVNAVDRQGHTCLHDALADGLDNVAEILREYGARPDAELSQN